MSTNCEPVQCLWGNRLERCDLREKVHTSQHLFLATGYTLVYSIYHTRHYTVGKHSKIKVPSFSAHTLYLGLLKNKKVSYQ